MLLEDHQIANKHDELAHHHESLASHHREVRHSMLDDTGHLSPEQFKKFEIHGDALKAHTHAARLHRAASAHYRYGSGHGYHYATMAHQSSKSAYSHSKKADSMGLKESLDEAFDINHPTSKKHDALDKEHQEHKDKHYAMLNKHINAKLDNMEKPDPKFNKERNEKMIGLHKHAIEAHNKASNEHHKAAAYTRDSRDPISFIQGMIARHHSSVARKASEKAMDQENKK